MNDLSALLAQLNTGDVKKNAAIGAGVGALLAKGGEQTLQHAVVGAGVGLALGWVLAQLSEAPASAPVQETQRIQE